MLVVQNQPPETADRREAGRREGYRLGPGSVQALDPGVVIMVEQGGFLGRADSQGYSLVDKAAVKHTATSASNSPWTRCGAQISAAKGPHDTTLNRRPGESADRGCQMSKFCTHSAASLTKPRPTIAAARRALLAELSLRCRQRSGHCVRPGTLASVPLDIHAGHRVQGTRAYAASRVLTWLTG